MILRDGSRVVTLGEVDGMPHPAPRTQAHPRWCPAISEICPTGEGMFVWTALRLLM
jgi:hypothetical protein